MAQLKVYVYRGEGVNTFSFRETMASLIEVLGKRYSVDPIDATRLRQGEWSADTVLLVLPGGRDVPYDTALRGEGNAQIRAYVEKGGSFLGICAGAYYGAREVCFDLGGPLEVVGSRELGFFPGTAVGPLYDPSAFSYESEAGSRAAWVTVGDKQFRVYYNGGCAFQSPEQYADNVSVIGQYLDATEERLAALVTCQVGQGLALLSGVHIEYRLRSLERLHLPVMTRPLLGTSEQMRQEVFRELTTYLVGRATVSRS